MGGERENSRLSLFRFLYTRIVMLKSINFVTILFLHNSQGLLLPNSQVACRGKVGQNKGSTLQQAGQLPLRQRLICKEKLGQPINICKHQTDPEINQGEAEG